MAATMRIPTEFTAVDKFTSVVSKMTAGVSNFSKSTHSAIDRVNSKVNGLWSSMDGFSQLALGAGFVGLGAAGVKSVMEYEDALASFRTIVSDLSDKDFAKYSSAIGMVANETKKSTIDVAKSFEKIAGLNSTFAQTETGLAAVSKASITLSKASGDELGVAAENLVGIMNQFNLGAMESDRVINVLAAGQAVGAASITQSAEAYKNFGAVAKGANITLEESQALVQTLGKFNMFGAEAGTKLRGVTLQLQKAGLGYASGQFNINDALADAVKKTNSLRSAREKDAYILKTFGAENITAGKILLSNIDVYKDYVKGVTGTSEAQKAAKINTSTLSSKWDELKNSLINVLTTNDKTNGVLDTTKGVLGFISNNLSTILKVLGFVIAAFVTFKAIVLASTIISGAYNIALGVMGALSGKAAIGIGANNIALGAYRATLGIATAAQWAWNVAMTANPVGLIIVGVAALIALIVSAIAYYDEWGAAILALMGPFGSIVNLIMSLRKHWDSIKEAFATGGIIAGFKRLGAVILDSVLYPIQQLLGMLAKIPGVGSMLAPALKGVETLRKNLGVSDEKKVEIVAPKQEAMKQQSAGQLNGNINLNVNDKNKNISNVKTDFSGIPVKTTSTIGQR